MYIIVPLYVQNYIFVIAEYPFYFLVNVRGTLSKTGPQPNIVMCSHLQHISKLNCTL